MRRTASFSASRSAQNQGVQFPFARAFAHLIAAEPIVIARRLSTTAEKDPGDEANAKLLAADASWEAAEACLQTHGGFGFAEEYDIERKFRETRLYQVAPISTNLIPSSRRTGPSVCRSPIRRWHLIHSEMHLTWKSPLFDLRKVVTAT